MKLEREVVLAHVPGVRLPQTHLPRRWKERRTTCVALWKERVLAPITVFAANLASDQATVKALVKHLGT
ncbi:MAG: hypothetical protein ACRDUX_38820, partial [Mycobacterium sp.]